jgi:hypothetical protein
MRTRAWRSGDWVTSHDESVTFRCVSKSSAKHGSPNSLAMGRTATTAVRDDQTRPMSASSSPPANECEVGGAEAACVLTADELAEYDGMTPGRQILIAYKGRDYAVGGLFMWMTGQHSGCVRAVT